MHPSLPQALSRRISVRARFLSVGSSSLAKPRKCSAPWIAAFNTGRLSAVREDATVSQTVSWVFAARTRPNLRPRLRAATSHVASFRSFGLRTGGFGGQIHIEHQDLLLKVVPIRVTMPLEDVSECLTQGHHIGFGSRIQRLCDHRLVGTAW